MEVNTISYNASIKVEANTISHNVGYHAIVAANTNSYHAAISACEKGWWKVEAVMYYTYVYLSFNCYSDWEWYWKVVVSTCTCFSFGN